MLARGGGGLKEASQPFEYLSFPLLHRLYLGPQGWGAGRCCPLWSSYSDYSFQTGGRRS